MADRRRTTHYSAEEVFKLLWEENEDSELENATSEEEEAELERQLGIFSEESRDEDNIEVTSVEGSQSLVSITDTFTFTTSATTTTATSGPAVATVSPSVSFPVATPAQESVAGPSCSFSGGSFYSTQQRTHVPAKRAQVEPPQKTPKTTSKESCGKGDVGAIGGLQREPSLNLPLAKIIPIVNGQVHHILFDSDNSYFQDLFKVGSARDFAANV